MPKSTFKQRRSRRSGATRLPRAVAAVLTAFALTLVTGCGVLTDPSKAVPREWVAPPSVSAQAQEFYTAEQIKSALDEITRFTLDRSFEPALLVPQEAPFAADQINAGVVDRMTPVMRDRWVQRVDAGLAGDAAEKDATRVLRFYDWEEPDWTVVEGESPLASQGIRGVEVDVAQATADAAQRLKITLIIDAVLQYQEPTGPFEIKVSKRISHWLVAADGTQGHQWQIDGYEGEIAVDEDLPPVASAAPAVQASLGVPFAR